MSGAMTPPSALWISVSVTSINQAAAKVAQTGIQVIDGI